MSVAFKGSFMSLASTLGSSGAWQADVAAAGIGTGARIGAGDVIDLLRVAESFSGVELLETEADLDKNKNQGPRLNKPDYIRS